MEAIGEYILRICCCALIVGTVQSVGAEGAGGKIRKLISGLLIAFVVISPLREVQLDQFWEIPESFYQEGQDISTQAQEDSKEAISSGIIQRTQAYILDEAESLDVKIEVTAITLDPDLFVPVQVELTGEISPHDRAVLSEAIQTDLGIEKEAQIWDS